MVPKRLDGLVRSWEVASFRTVNGRRTLVLVPRVTDANPTDWLRLEYSRRRKINPSYSLRSFANCLRIPSGRLSEIFSGKRHVTVPMAKVIAVRLAFTPEEANQFLQLVTRRKAAWRHSEGVTRSESSTLYDQVETDTFHCIADWQHYALLSLVELDDFNPDPAWIARRLGISSVEVRLAVARLVRLGLLEQDDKSLRRKRRALTTTNGIPSSALRRSHQQTLEQAILALEGVPVELRDISSITMPISIRKLPEAKRMIQEFRRGLAEFLENGDREEVYNLNVQLVPVTKVKEPSC